MKQNYLCIGPLNKEHITALDAGCGTGQMSFSLSKSKDCKIVVGVDISEKMIKRAQQKLSQFQKNKQFMNVEFHHGYIGLNGFTSQYKDQFFDVAFACMVLHEMLPNVRIQFLKELARVSKQVVILDYSHKIRIRNRVVEFIAGPQHFSGFIDFLERGAIQQLIKLSGLQTNFQQTLDGDTLDLFIVQNT